MKICYRTYEPEHLACRFDYVGRELVLYRTGHSNTSSQVKKRIESGYAVFNKFVCEHPSQVSRLDIMAFHSRMRAYEGYFHLKEGERGKAATKYLQAIGNDPFRSDSWKGLIKTCLGIA